LDVGHANSAVIQAGNAVIVVDAPPGPVLADFLKTRGLRTIDLVLVSHADEDHAGGLITLLLGDFAVRRLLINPDATKRTKVWDDIRTAITVAMEQHQVSCSFELTSNTPTFTFGAVTVEVVAPSPDLFLSGAGGVESRSSGNRNLTSNSMSAVIRVVHDHVPRALLMGDLDLVGLDDLEKKKRSLTAELLVFPHHGGYAGTRRLADFAERLCRAVNPAAVVFSIGRGKHGTPRPEVVAAVEAACGNVRVACTQLSERCAVVNPSAARVHLVPLPAHGAETNTTCAGTIVQNLMTGAVLPIAEEHREFIRVFAPTHLCLGGAAAQMLPRP
jgi:competence protein ComEC